jgi:hypothetical protein
VPRVDVDLLERNNMSPETTPASPKSTDAISGNSYPTVDNRQDSAGGEASRFAEKRREARYVTNDPVEVCLLEMGKQRVGGIVRDVSRNGLRIEISMPLSKGTHVEIVLGSRAIIFAEARYCRRALDIYHVGFTIEDVYYAQPTSAKHIDDEQLSFYLIGKGLRFLEVIHIKNHLAGCQDCCRRLSEADAILNPIRRRTLIKEPGRKERV